ncbi:hypothetical protein ACH4NT_36615 [Streptomyces lydicus]|uniref:hypothetical protein n=1 Tax=Streptomyces lydicus TaxID=47763 RepID=UPI0037B8D758
MIKLITKKRLAEITAQRDHFEARLSAVQLRLARIKGERDQLLKDFDDRAVLAQAQAAKLERELKAEKRRAAELAGDVTQASKESAELRKVEEQLLDVIDYLFTAAEAPVEVLVRDGVVHSVHRARQAAEAAARKADPSIGEGPWRPTPPDKDRREGWLAVTHRLPETERPPHFQELADRYCHADGKTLFTCSVDNWSLLVAHLNDNCQTCKDALVEAPEDTLLGAGQIAYTKGEPAQHAYVLIRLELERRLTAAASESARAVTA